MRKNINNVIITGNKSYLEKSEAKIFANKIVKTSINVNVVFILQGILFLC